MPALLVTSVNITPFAGEGTSAASNPRTKMVRPKEFFVLL
jgi:hypothetical protein